MAQNAYAGVCVFMSYQFKHPRQARKTQPITRYCSEYGGWGGGHVSTPMSLVCSASWGEGSDYNLVPTPKGHYLLK